MIEAGASADWQRHSQHKRTLEREASKKLVVVGINEMLAWVLQAT
jgi:hypothetical protein